MFRCASVELQPVHGLGKYQEDPQMATQQIINIGTSPNDGNGDPLRTAFQKTNQNFSVLFGIAGVTGIANGTSNISIPVANSNIIMSVGNVANVVTVLANGMTTLGNHSVSAFLNAGNVTSAGTITANGTIQSLGAVTAVTVTASGNLVGSNLNVTNQMRASTLLLTGNVINAELNVTGNIVAAALTSTGTLTVAANTNVAGNVQGSFFIGNGSQLTGVTAAPANIFNIMNVTGSPLVIADSPNDTLNFTFGNNITIEGNAVTDTLNFALSESPTFSGTVTATTFVGDVKGSVFADDSTLMVDAVDNKLLANQVLATGNIAADYFLGNGALLTGVITSVANISNGNSNVAIAASNGNVSFNISGVDDVMLVTPDTVRINANLQIDGELQYVNVTTLSIKDPIIGMGRNANNTPLTVNDGKDRGSQLWYYDSSEKSAFFGWQNSSGNLFIANDVSIANEIVSINNLGNISLGNISAESLSSTANISAPYFLGNVLGNISGNLVVAGSNTQVIFNDDGVANAVAGFIFNKSNNFVAVSGNVTAANITATGNVTGGNINTAGNATAAFFIGDGSQLSNISVGSGTSIQNGNSNVNVAFNGNVTVGTYGTVVAEFADVGLFITGNVTTNVVILSNGAEIKDTTGNAVSFGLDAGASSQGPRAVAIGPDAGNNNQGESSVAVGDIAASVDQGIYAVAIGYEAGNNTQGNSSVAIGRRAGGENQGQQCIAIGDDAGTNSQASNAVAIGYKAGFSSQGSNAVAIGALAGENSAANNSIIINATGVALDVTVANTFVLAPVRNDVANLSEIFFYNTTSKEVTYANAINIEGNIATAGVITVNSNNNATAIVNGGSNAAGNIGSSSKYFNRVFATSTSALYADLAEKYLADQHYDAGTILSFGGVNEVTQSSAYGDLRVAGVVSTHPAYSMNDGLQGEHVVSLALVGRVPCRVTGVVERGDMMISAGNGMACACTIPEIGSVIGKAVQDFPGGDGVIEILVGRI
jgi:hypothetical protein